MYRAVHKPTGKVVALKKCLLDDMKENMGEIEILRECDSPHIVKYFGNYVFDDFLWVFLYSALSTASR